MQNKFARFAEWKDKVGLKGSDLMAILKPLSERADAEELINKAIGSSWSIDQMKKELEKPAKAAPQTAPDDKKENKSDKTDKTDKDDKNDKTAGAKPVVLPAGNPSSAPAKSKRNPFEFLTKLFSKKGKPASAAPAKSGKKNQQMLIIGVVVLAVLAILGVAGYMYMNNTGSGTTLDLGLGNGNATAENPVETVPADQALTNASPEQKELWAQNQLNNSITESFLDKPESFGDFFGNFGKYLNWLLYFTAAPLIFLSIMRERSQARDFTDIKLSFLGLFVMLLMVWFSSMLAGAVAANGLAQKDFIMYIFLGIGFIVNLALAIAATMSGETDYSILAACFYISGLFLKWWFPDAALLPTVGIILIVIGLAIQCVEINRNKGLKKSIIAAAVMLFVFIAMYLWIFGLLQAQITAFVIPADVAAQASAALKLSLLVKGQVAISAIVGLAMAYLTGLVYGMIFLQTKGKDGKFDFGKAVILDADAQSLFIMFLFIFLPWIWLLPKYAMLLGIVG